MSTILPLPVAPDAVTRMAEREYLNALDAGALRPRPSRIARQRRVAHDLVELSRLQRGEERGELAPVGLGLLLRAICAEYDAEIFGAMSTVVQSDSRRLARIVFILLDNATLHGRPSVSVCFDATGIVVTDRGPGFPGRLLPHAMQPFVSGVGARGVGLGLGLAIAAGHAALLNAALIPANDPQGGGARVALAFTATRAPEISLTLRSTANATGAGPSSGR